MSTIEIPGDLICAAGTTPETRPTFSLVAYNGGGMKLPNVSRHPVVIDLTGLEVSAQKLPLRMSHSGDTLIGHTETIEVSASTITARGVISHTNAAATGVVESAKNGFPWQASIGATILARTELRDGATATVNGAEVRGPAVIVTRSRLCEISVVDLGADGTTRVDIAARERHTMDRDETTAEPETTEPTTTEGTPGVISAARAKKRARKEIDALLMQAIREPGADLDALEAISTRADNEGLTATDVELAILRLGRTAKRHGLQPRGSSAPLTNDILAAAVLMDCGFSDDSLAADRDYGDEVVTRARKHRGLGMHGIMGAAIEASGQRPPHGGANLYSAMVDLDIRAGFSGVTLPGILGNVGNKMLLQSFTEMEALFPTIAGQSDLANFQKYNIYRLDATGGFEKIAGTGELKQGALVESAFSNQLGTYGRILSISRQQWINDDLNALQQIFQILGRKAKLAVEKALFTLIMEASDVFYTSGNGNRNTSNALTIAGLGVAEAAMMKQVDTDGEPLYLRGWGILVPPELAATGDQLWTSSQVGADATSTGIQRPTDNPYKGRFRVFSSPYLSIAAMAGYSTTTWYMLANPARVPAFEVGYLSGARAPTVATKEMAFKQLGTDIRAYFDFGVAQADPKGASKNTA